MIEKNIRTRFLRLRSSKQCKSGSMTIVKSYTEDTNAQALVRNLLFVQHDAANRMHTVQHAGLPQYILFSVN